MSGWLAVLARDVRLALRQGVDNLMAVVFFVLACVLFPFGIGPEPATLTRIAPGIIWVAALLAALLSLERLFLSDFEDGSLDLLALAPPPLVLIVGAKVMAHWLTTAVPLLLATPVLGLLLNLDGGALLPLLASLLLGTPTLSLLGAVGAALVLGARRAGVLLALILLPLYIPVLIFGAAAVDAALFGQPVTPHLKLLGGLLLGSLALAPWTAALALRQALR
jgi:heme exporter protein B